MASVRTTRDRISTSPGRGDVVFAEIDPSHAWMEDPDCHYLLVDLPDFKKEGVKIQVISSGIIKVNGERAINDKKRIRFEKTFKVPEGTDVNAISARFDGEAQILYVNVPKQKMDEEEREPEPEPHSLKDQQNNIDETRKENVHEKHGNDNVYQARGANEERIHENAPATFSNENARGWECETRYEYLRSAIKVLARNKMVVVTALLAFSVGMFMSHKFDSNKD